MNQLKGSAQDGVGWESAFFTATPPSITTQAVNYTITLMRGLGSIGAGFVIVKLGHKKSVLIALLLLSCALPAIAASYWQSIGGYIIFVLGRMLMAVGGTVLVIYTQPVISAFFKTKTKSVLSRVNPLGFNIGTALPLILFAIPSVNHSMLAYWRIWAFIIASIPIALLIIYFLVAEDIKIDSTTKDYESSVKLKPATWNHVMRDKNTWPLAIFYGFWLIAVVSVILITPYNFADLHAQRFDPLPTWKILLPIIFYLFGIIPGIWLIGGILKTNIDRRYYIAIVMAVGIGSLLAAYLCTAYIENIIWTSIFMFIAGIALWGIQGVVLNNPHEVKTNSPYRVSIVIAFTWGIGYIIYTISNVILASIFDALNYSNAHLELAAWVQFGLAIFFMLGSVVSAIFIQQTKTGTWKNSKHEIKKIFKK